MLRTVADKDVRHARIFSGFLPRPLRRNCSSFPPRSESRTPSGSARSSIRS